jgi:uncharacterized protein YjbJ (UPF0337 family)
MDENRFEGGVRELGGKAKEAVGGFVGDAKTQAEGRFDQAAGAVQRNYGAAKDAASEGLEALAGTVREQPLLALGIAVALGWVIGRIGRYI